MPDRTEVGVLARVAAAFVAPADGTVARGCAPEGAPAPPRAAVLCRPADALALGGALAIGYGRGPAVVCVWRGAAEAAGPVVSAPALPGALRLAERLGDRGHYARVTGRLVVVELEDDPGGEAARAAAACEGAPVVCALAGPRGAALDRLLLTQDVVFVAVAADDPPALGEVALDGLTALGARARVLAVPAGAGPARALASAGVALLPPLRAAVEAAG